MGFFSKLFGRSEKAPAFDGNKIYSPVSGKAVPVTEVPDPTFAEGLLGNGIAILPTDGKIYSPVDGTVGTMFDTGHACALTSTTGVELLIHVGRLLNRGCRKPAGPDRFFRRLQRRFWHLL